MAMNRKRLTGLSVFLGLLAIAPTAANAATEQVPKCYGVTGFDDTFRVMRIKTDFGDSFGGNMRAVFVKWQNSDGQFLGSGAQTTSIASPGMIELAFTATSVDFVGGFGRIWGVIMVLDPVTNNGTISFRRLPDNFAVDSVPVVSIPCVAPASGLAPASESAIPALVGRSLNGG